MDILFLVSGGIGDQILGLQCAIAVKEKHPDLNVDVISISRDDVFKPLHHLFRDGGILLYQHPEREKWGENHWILQNQKELNVFPHKLKYYIVPDLLHRNPLAFDFQKFGQHMSVIREKRCLTKKWKPGKKRIYMALNTSTPEYKYPDIKGLISKTAELLPDYEVYFNDLTAWAGHSLDNNAQGDYPPNVAYVRNEPFISSLNKLMESDYVVCLDNGISHIAYQLGIPRSLISHRLDHKGVMWVARWYPQLADCITYDYAPRLPTVIKQNLECPQTLLIPRLYHAMYPGFDCARTLGFKY